MLETYCHFIVDAASSPKNIYQDSSYVIAKDFTMTPKNTTHVIRDMPWKAKQKINIMKSASHAYI
jgi:hypothetical protein